MTLIGIAGCTALIYAGLGLQSAVNSIGNIQFSKVRPVDIEIYLNGELEPKEVEELEKDIRQKQHIKETTPVRQQSITAKANNYSKDVFYIAVSSKEIGKYMNLKNRKTSETILWRSASSTTIFFLSSFFVVLLYSLVCFPMRFRLL